MANKLDDDDINNYDEMEVAITSKRILDGLAVYNEDA